MYFHRLLQQKVNRKHLGLSKKLLTSLMNLLVHCSCVTSKHWHPLQLKRIPQLYFLCQWSFLEVWDLNKIQIPGIYFFQIIFNGYTISWLQNQLEVPDRFIQSIFKSIHCTPFICFSFKFFFLHSFKLKLQFVSMHSNEKIIFL